jgi:futalosine hydrolase
MSLPSYGGVSLDEFLVVHAAPVERANDLRLVPHELGVGKVAAAMELYSLLIRLESVRPARGVLLVGVAGSYPARVRGSAPPGGPGEVCVVASDVLADEGVATPGGFVDFGKPREHGMRLVDTGPFPASPRMAAEAAARLGCPLVKGATVSTCSGVDALAQELHGRTHADVETMEGAAVAAVCRRRETPLLHVRAISNWTGDRDRGAWDLGRAVDALHAALQRLCTPAD